MYPMLNFSIMVHCGIDAGSLERRLILSTVEMQSFDLINLCCPISVKIYQSITHCYTSTIVLILLLFLLITRNLRDFLYVNFIGHTSSPFSWLLQPKVHYIPGRHKVAVDCYSQKNRLHCAVRYIAGGRMLQLTATAKRTGCIVQFAILLGAECCSWLLQPIEQAALCSSLFCCGHKVAFDCYSQKSRLHCAFRYIAVWHKVSINRFRLF